MYSTGECYLTNPLFLGFFLLLLGFGSRQLERVRRSILARTDLLPGAGTTLKVAESLRELKRLSNDALLLFVVTNFGVASQWEILAERVTLEAVIGHDASQVRVAGKEDTIQVVHLALIPVGAVEEAGDARNGRGFVGIRLDADARVVSDREHIIDNLEALVPGWIVGGCDGTHLSKLGGSIVCGALAKPSPITQDKAIKRTSRRKHRPRSLASMTYI